MWRLAAALSLALWGGAVVAGPVDLTADQMRTFGSEALARGYADQALAVAETLLQRDPEDSLALTLKAQALRVLGQLDASEAAARAAWATADSDTARYGAATALAQALSLQERRTSAQYWLRQAVQNAPNDGTRAQAVQDFNYVRDQNPVSLQFSGMIRPSDNVNGGGKVEYIRVGPFILPLPSTLIALSGTTWALGVAGQYRLSDDGKSQTALTFGVNGQGVALSEAAQVKAPDLANGDFFYGQVEVGLQRRADLSFGRVVADVSLGHSWYGGLDLADNLTVEVSLARTLGPDLGLQLGASVTRQVRIDSFEASSTTYATEATVTKRLSGGAQIAATLDLAEVVSDNVGTDRSEAGLALQWQGGKPVAGLALGANLSMRYSIYANEREDRRYAVGLQATVNKATYLGFAPVISLDVTHNDSSIPWFTADTVALGLSLKSRF